METLQDGVKSFLKARTVGVCIAISRLLNFRVVRSTRPVVFTPVKFVPDAWARTTRSPDHCRRCPGYPGPTYFLNRPQKDFFRNPALRHLRQKLWR